MWWTRRRIYFTLIFLSASFALFSQGRHFTIEIDLSSKATKQPIGGAELFLQERGAQFIEFNEGSYLLDSLPAGSYHIQVFRIGYLRHTHFIKLTKDTALTISLEASQNNLAEVLVRTSKNNKTAEERKLDKVSISQVADRDVAGILEEINGVRSLRQGSQIGKPIVNGLYGNRLSILQNGVALAGQQWGLDHAPEIDPLSASSIEVLTGSDLIEYQNNSAGAAILFRADSVKSEPHIHGRFKQIYQSNGRELASSIDLAQKINQFGWRINGTYRNGGDRRSPNYYLTNTGNRLSSMNLQMSYEVKKHFRIELLNSFYQSKLGLLRGSHISNISDLDLALRQEEPFFTEDQFSRTIYPPYQDVSHLQNQVKIHWSPSKKEKWLLNAAFQRNDRREFDPRRAGRDSLPALSLLQSSFFTELKRSYQWNDKNHGSAGVQWRRIDNFNNPETGILPLIPDYISNKWGAFSRFTHRRNRHTFTAAARIDREQRNSVVISREVTREILRYNRDYTSFQMALEWDYYLSKNQILSWHSSIITRAPEPNELFSNGLHQGVAGLELGHAGLRMERSALSKIAYRSTWNKKWQLEGTIYTQSIDQFIYLYPTGETRLTIRGAYPVFEYRQDPALFAGADMALLRRLGQRGNAGLRYNFLRAINLANDEGLVNMPPNQFIAHLQLGLPSMLSSRNNYLRINYQATMKQRNVDPSIDFLPPPSAFQLWHASLGTQWTWNKGELDLQFKVYNIFNTNYRNYLNRLRYFAEEQGRNWVVAITYNF